MASSSSSSRQSVFVGAGQEAAHKTAEAAEAAVAALSAVTAAPMSALKDEWRRSPSSGMEDWVVCGHMMWWYPTLYTIVTVTLGFLGSTLLL